MQRYRSATLILGLVIATTVAGAQGFPQPANTPPPDAATPRGVQRSPVSPSAQTRADAVVTMAGCVQEGATQASTTAPAAGPAAGTTGATPAEKAAERTGNVPDPHEGKAATGQAAERDRATTNGDLPARDAHKVYFLINATMAADGGRSREVTGTSGLTSPKGYRLEGDSAKIEAHVNQQVRVVGSVQNPETSAGAGGAGDSSPILRVQSMTMLSKKCQS